MILFILGYLARHLVGWLFRRYHRPAPAPPNKEFTIEGREIREMIVSFDGGKTWYIRTNGWTKVNHEFIRNLLIHHATDNPGANNAPTYPTVT